MVSQERCQRRGTGLQSWRAPSGRRAPGSGNRRAPGSRRRNRRRRARARRTLPEAASAPKHRPHARIPHGRPQRAPNRAASARATLRARAVRMKLTGSPSARASLEHAFHLGGKRGLAKPVDCVGQSLGDGRARGSIFRQIGVVTACVARQRMPRRGHRAHPPRPFQGHARAPRGACPSSGDIQAVEPD